MKMTVAEIREEVFSCDHGVFEVMGYHTLRWIFESLEAESKQANKRIAELEDQKKVLSIQHSMALQLAKDSKARLDESNKRYRAMHADASGFEARIEELDDVGRRLDRAFVKKCKESEEQDTQITAAINTLRAGALPFFTGDAWAGKSIRKALKQLGYEEDISQDPGAGEEGG